MIAVPPEHPLATDPAGPVGLARFADEPWVWLRRDASPDYHDQLLATCRRAGFRPDVRHLTDSITIQLAMVAGGLGVTLGPTFWRGRSSHPWPTGSSPTAPTWSNCPW